MKTNLTMLIMLLCLTAAAQNSHGFNVDSIVAEGKTLYRMERASWLGTDAFIAAYKEQGKIGGYFSYPENSLTRCVFVSEGEQPEVVGSVSFDSSFNVQNAKTDIGRRKLTDREHEIWSMRQAALQLVVKDTFFKKYQNTSFNLIPLLDATERKVYIITATKEQGKLYFGNDYLVTFDKDNTVTEKKKFHNSLIPSPYGETKNGMAVAGVHTHLPHLGQLMTATDICTLLLYGKITNWKYYMVVSADYVSMWVPADNNLKVLTQKEFQKMIK